MPCCDTGRNIQKYKGAAASTLQDVTDNGNTTTGDIITTSGFFIGDGSKLTGISGASAAFTLQETSDRGNTTSNVVQFTNPITSFTASGNVIVSGNVTASSFYGLGTGISEIDPNSLTSAVSISKGGTGSTTATDAASALGVGTEDSPQFTGIKLGDASDTTLLRSSPGVVTIQGQIIRTGDVALGTQTSGNYVKTVTAGDGLDMTGSAGEGSDHTLSLDLKENHGLVIDNTELKIDLKASGGLDFDSGQMCVKLDDTDINGTLPVSKGGTNITTYATGDILIASDTNTLSNLALGTDSYVLTSNSTTGLPEWKSASNIGTTVATLSNTAYIIGGDYNGGSAKTWSLKASTANSTDHIVIRDNSGDIYAREYHGDGGTLSNIVGSQNLQEVIFENPYTSSSPYFGAGSYGAIYGSNTINASTISTATGFYGPIKGSNTITASGVYGPIYGSNTITTSGVYGPIKGSNTITTSGVYGPIKGSNTISASTISTATGFYGPIEGSNTITGTTLNVNTLISDDASAINRLNASNINSGTLSNAYGGTGFTSYSQGDLLVGTGSNLRKLARGAANYVLTVNGLGNDIEWQAASGGGSSLWTQSGNDIYYDTGNVGISNSTTNHTVHLGSNVIVNDTGNYDVFRVNGNVFSTGYLLGDGSKILNLKTIKTEADTDVIITSDGGPVSYINRFYR